MSGTAAGAGKSPLYCYQNCRNRLLFAARHLGARDALRWVVLAPRYAERVVRRGRGRRELLGRPDIVWAAARGTAAGIALVLRALSMRLAKAVDGP
jgi:hypothetical protein